MKSKTGILGFVQFLHPYIFLCVMFLAGGLPIYAADYYVSVNGSDITGDGSKSAPWASVTKAIASSAPSPADPAKIRIAQGTYSEEISLCAYVELYGGYEDTNWSRDTSAHQTAIQPPDPDTYDPTINAADHTRLDGLLIRNGSIGVNCDNASPIITDCRIEQSKTAAIYVSGQDASPTITQNTITENKEGIFLYNAGAPIIRHNTIKKNTGNAITAQNSSPVIENNILRENSLSGLNLASVSTGTICANQILRNNQYGLFCYNSAPLIANNCIAFNPSGGIYCRAYASPRIVYNTLYLNGNGIALQDSSPEITNNISYKNDNYGIVEVYRYSDPALRHNCLWGNLRGNYKDEGTTVCWTTDDFANLIDNAGAPVEGNIARDPRLADVSHENFRLLPSSPCINAGYPVADIATDFEGTPRPSSAPDIGADEYIDLFDFTFDTGSEEWEYVSVPDVFTPPGSAATDGALMLRASGSNTFGFWQSPAGRIPVFENVLYRATWSVSTDVTTRSLVPGVRMRLNEEDFQMSAAFRINSNLDGAVSPTPDGVTYEQYYRPLQGSSFKSEKAGWVFCSFDLINIGTNDKDDGAIFLNELQLEWRDLASLDDSFTTETIFDFEAGTDGWQFRSVPDFFTPPTQEVGSSRLGLRSVDSNTFGYWESPPQPVIYGRFYRVRFFITTDATPRSKVPMLRLRVNPINNQAAFGIRVNSNTDGDSSPIPTEVTPYEIYYVPPASAQADGVYIAYDIVNLNPNDALTGALYVDRVEVHSAPLPLW